MVNTYIEMETLKFLLFNVHFLKRVLEQERFLEYDEASMAMMLDAV
jgi:butyryl-CoA dehydrogenase